MSKTIRYVSGGQGWDGETIELMFIAPPLVEIKHGKPRLKLVK